MSKMAAGGQEIPGRSPGACRDHVERAILEATDIVVDNLQMLEIQATRHVIEETSLFPVTLNENNPSGGIAQSDHKSREPRSGTDIEQ